tara:strand:- start:1129 stop:1476 length:348 start_codon:yes stop_codon:yes gene_type:complete
MSAYKKAIGWLAKTLSRRKPRKIKTRLNRPERGYPFLGSLDANFQDYAKKNLLNLKGFGSGPANRVLRADGTIGMPNIPKSVPPKVKTVPGKQLRIPGMKSGGSSLRKVNGNWVR